MKPNSERLSLQRGGGGLLASSLGLVVIVMIAALSNVTTHAFSHHSTFTIRSPSSSSSPPSFYSTNQISKHANNNRSKSSSSSLLSMVVDRMSDECVAATQVSHKIGNEIGLRLLRNEVLIAGIANRPERSGRTLAKYNLMYPLVRKSAERTLEQSGFQLSRKVNRDTLASNGEKQLKFSEEVKFTLTKASRIADHFGSDLIHSEHVLLALMGYNFGNPVDQLSLTAAFNVLKNSEGVAVDDVSKFSAYDFCEELAVDMREPYDLNENPVTEEVVVIGGGSSKTNTLEEVGVDLTQMALEGKLDKVFGRDKEIGMALRTLGRRRKNNPCLIGDPGVGKVRTECNNIKRQQIGT